MQRATPVTRVLPFSCSRSRFRSKPPQPLFAEGNTGYTCVAFFHALEAGSGHRPLNPSLQRGLLQNSLQGCNSQSPVGKYFIGCGGQCRARPPHPKSFSRGRGDNRRHIFKRTHSLEAGFCTQKSAHGAQRKPVTRLRAFAFSRSPVQFPSTQKRGCCKIATAPFSHHTPGNDTRQWGNL